MSQSCNQRPEKQKSSTTIFLPSYLQILPLYIWFSLPLECSNTKKKLEGEKKWQAVYSRLGVQSFDHGGGVPNKFASREHGFT
ncbi:hypothetical protein VIGAN_08238500 [Vigna angularis var. angularis]|uniref:Uncharacterized protein n=1 Tax=Vigna angularis var. angularis TaxID=157739 RepID=A0A0S3SS23_PHAAN|nr:hypothetical protein VIGAN_08238500 [Vigna angularis var. angularis]